jgi:hypothetical protein
VAAEEADLLLEISQACERLRLKGIDRANDFYWFHGA